MVNVYGILGREVREVEGIFDSGVNLLECYTHSQLSAERNRSFTLGHLASQRMDGRSLQLTYCNAHVSVASFPTSCLPLMIILNCFPQHKIGEREEEVNIIA